MRGEPPPQGRFAATAGRRVRRCLERCCGGARLLGRPRHLHIFNKWLQERYGCEVVAFTADLGQGGEELSRPGARPCGWARRPSAWRTCAKSSPATSSSRCSARIRLRRRVPPRHLRGRPRGLRPARRRGLHPAERPPHESRRGGRPPPAGGCRTPARPARMKYSPAPPPGHGRGISYSADGFTGRPTLTFPGLRSAASRQQHGGAGGAPAFERAVRLGGLRERKRLVGEDLHRARAHHVEEVGRHRQ